MRILVIDALTLGNGRRKLTRDFIGAGPRMVAATIKEKGQDVEIIRGEKFLADPGYFSKRFDVCFISAMKMDINATNLIASTWHSRKKSNNSLVFVGGPIALEPHVLLRNQAISGVICGESERILWDLLDHDDLTLDLIEDVDCGIITRKNYRGINIHELISKWRPNIEFIESIDPGIDLLSFYDNYWAGRIYIEALRGCSNFLRARIDGQENLICTNCGYCDKREDLNINFRCPQNQPPGCGFCNTVILFGPVRSFHKDYIIRQVKDCVALGCHRIVLGASDFLEYQREKFFKLRFTSPFEPPPPNYDALESLVNRLLEIKAIKNNKVQIFIENVKTNLCDDESLKIISRLPKISMAIGVETGCDGHLEKIGKASRIDNLRNAVTLANKYNIRFNAYFIHSLPGQNQETIEKSAKLMQWLYKNNVEKITIYKFKPLPETAFSNFKMKDKTDKLSHKMIKTALTINKKKKLEYVGLVVRALIAEPDFKDERDAIGYMLEGGPKIKVKNGKPYINDNQIHFIRIEGVISDKILTGRLLK
ncbi:MAG: B12-binding domain-containing radical SAM protein [Promethearchaeota archaeon]